MVEEASAAPMEAQAEPTLEEAPKFNPVFSLESVTAPLVEPSAFNVHESAGGAS